MLSFPRRLKYVRDDYLETTAQPCLQGIERERKELEFGLPDTLQWRWSTLAGWYHIVAGAYFAFGYPLANVRAYLIECAQAWLKVFELRGTGRKIPLLHVTLDSRYAGGDPRAVIERRQIYTGEETDFSLTNSRDNRFAVYIALSAGEIDAAAKLASMAWDPANDYVGWRSRVCTPNDQHLAYAIRELFAGKPEAVLSELKQIRIKKKNAPERFQRPLVRALAERNAPAFLKGLDELLASHWQRSRHAWYRHDAALFMCLPALGLSKLALHFQIITVNMLPRDQVQFPVELLELAPGAETDSPSVTSE